MKTCSTVRSFLTLLFFICTTYWAQAQAPSWQTALAVGLSSAGASSAVWGTAVGPAGDVYVVGGFDGTASFGPHTLTSAGNADIFVAKWSPAMAQFVWAQRAGGTGNDAAHALTVVGNGIYLTGTFTSTVTDFGSITLYTNANPTSNVFVAKLTDNGTSSGFSWVQPSISSNTGLTFGRAIAVSGTSVYIAGGFGGTVQFGATTLQNAALYIPDVFVAKLTENPGGASFVWARQAGGADAEQVNGLAVAGNNVYLTGPFASPAITFGSTSLTNRGGIDTFLAKLTDAGGSAAFTWGQQLGGTSNETGTAVAVANNQVYVTGGFGGNATIGTTTLTTITSSAGGSDVFLIKLLDAGTTSSVVWTQQTSGAGSISANALALNGANIYLTGRFSGTTATFGLTTLTKSGSNTDVFLTRLLDAGSTARFIWAQQAGSTGNNYGHAVSVTSGGSVYVGGQVTPAASFGSLSVLGTTTNSLGFLASLSALPLATTPPADLATRLYPNPAHGTVTVPLPTGLTTLTLLDALGRAVRVQTATGPRTVLPLTGLPAGVYAVRLTSGSGSTTQQLVVE